MKNNITSRFSLLILTPIIIFLFWNIVRAISENNIFFFIIGLLILGLLAMWYWQNSITLTNDQIISQRFWRFKRKIIITNTGHAYQSNLPSSSTLELDKTMVVPIKNIVAINVVTLTPLIATRTSINQINWRDSVEIVYFDHSNTHKMLISERLYLFPGLKSILLEIQKQLPSTQIFFSKNTGADNLFEQGLLARKIKLDKK